MRKNFEDYDNSFYLNKDWIFPYSEIPAGASVLLYGAGDVGQAYYRQIQQTGYCIVSQWVDKNAGMYREWGCPVDLPDNLNLESEYAVIAVASSDAARDINKLLVGKGISQDKVIWIGEKRQLINCSVRKSRLGDPVRIRLRDAFRRQGIDPFGEDAATHIESAANSVERDEKLILPRLVVEITPACTLRSEQCNN